MINVKFIPTGGDKSNFTQDGQGKESLKEAQSKTVSKADKGPLTKMGDLTVDISKGKGFEPKLRHKLFIRLQNSKNKDMTQTVKDSATPEFNEKIIIPIYKKDTQDVPDLVIQDLDPDSQDLLATLNINFSKIAYTKTQAAFAQKWYAFDTNPEKVLQLTLSFVNAKFEPPKHQKAKTEMEEEETEVHLDRAPTPKMTEFRFDDQTVPDPRNTNKFEDSHPSEVTDDKFSEEAEADDINEDIERDVASDKDEEENYIQSKQFNIGDDANLAEDSGSFSKL